MAPQPTESLREILVVRHGEAVSTLEGRNTTSTCGGLTKAGISQAQAVARRMHEERQQGHEISAIYCSTIRRASQTADVIARSLEYRSDRVRELSGLRTPDPGPNAEGQPWEQLRRSWPADPLRPNRPLAAGGEPWSTYLNRAHAALEGIIADHPTGRILIVGHSETVDALLTHLIGVTSLAGLKIDLDPAALTRIAEVREWPGVQVPQPRWRLMCHNDTAHLAVSSRRPS